MYDFHGCGSKIETPSCLRSRQTFENSVIKPSSPQFKWIHFETLRLHCNL
ncbi:putative Zona pellucida domain-containing protein [Helianthus annuus]|nr:putative Zona pellucida domain-containing protein [Helianthus annuus]